MEYLGMALMFVGGLWILVLAFQSSIWWGLGSLIVPLVALAYTLMNLRETWKPFVIWALGIVLFGANMSAEPGLE